VTGRLATGSYGAIAIVEFKTKVGGVMVTIPRGGFIPASVVLEWPLQNRLAMGTSERVRYFVSEGEAREAFPEEFPEATQAAA
jgi:hypothetical protein